MDLQKELTREKEYSRHLKRMVFFFSSAFGFSLGTLLAVLTILSLTKI